MGRHDTYISAPGPPAVRGPAVRRPFPFAGRASVVFLSRNPYIFRMRKESGFTLIELLITLVVAGVLAVTAIPSFKTSILNNRLVTESNEILGALLYARSQAITLGASQGHSVMVCTSSDNSTCSSGSWQNGWIISGYTYPPGAATTDSTASAAAPQLGVMRIYPAFTDGNRVVASPATSIAFDKTGATTSGGSAFILCDSRGNSFARSIYLYANGEARISTTPGKNLDGSAITGC